MTTRRYQPGEKWEILLEALGSTRGPEEVCAVRGISLLELRRWLQTAREGAIERLTSPDLKERTPTSPPTTSGSYPSLASSDPTSRPTSASPPSSRPGQDASDLDQIALAGAQELREPLRGLKAIGQFLKEDLADRLQDKDISLLAQLDSAATRMNDVLDGLTDIARFHPRPESYQSFRLAPLLEEVRARLTAFLRSHNAVVLIDSNLPKVVGEPQSIGEAFRQLIHNGIKFNSAPVPRVEITARAHGVDELFRSILIRDNGIGIEKRHHATVFRPFVRLHPYETYPGAGLGLTVARRVIEAQGGSLQVESGSQEGTTLVVMLAGAS